MTIKIILSACLFFTSLAFSNNHQITEEITKPNNSEPIIYKSRETSEGASVNLKWIETKENGLRTIKQETSKTIETTYGNESTERWTFKNKENNDMVEVIISNNIGTIYVTKNAVATSKSFNLNNQPFKYPPSFYMSEFINSQEKTLFIWVSNKADGELRQMIFTKIGNETVTIDGESYDCIKMEMKPTGFAGIFWQAFYWFEINSGTFIKYFGKKGPPGTPDFTIEKIN